jgi:hypothetical protein
MTFEENYQHIMKMRLRFGIESLSDHELSLMISNEAPKENLLSKEAVLEEEKRLKEKENAKDIKSLRFFNPQVFEEEYSGNDHSNLNAKQKRALWEKRNRIRTDDCNQSSKKENPHQRKKDFDRPYKNKYH